MKKIIGQDKILDKLARIVRTRQEAPSYLFSGPKGVGKFLTARWFCAAVLCENSRGGFPCGECSACRRVVSGNHPDIRVLSRNFQPGGAGEGESKEAVSAKAAIGIDEIREGIAAVQTCAYEGGFRFWIIDEAQRMTDEAQSALLKTLEEPPAALILILTAQGSGGGLLPTVVSRCRRFAFSPIPAPELGEFLTQRGCEQRKAQAVARICHGSLGLALSYLEDSALWDRRTAVWEIMNSVRDGNIWDALEAASKIEALCGASSARSAAAVEQMQVVLDIMLSCLRDVLCVKVGGGENLLVNVDCRQLIDSMASSMSAGDLEKHLERLMEAKKQLARAANAKLLWQSVMLGLQH